MKPSQEDELYIHLAIAVMLLALSIQLIVWSAMLITRSTSYETMVISFLCSFTGYSLLFGSLYMLFRLFHGTKRGEREER